MNAQRKQARSQKTSSTRSVDHDLWTAGATLYRATVVDIAESGEVFVRLDEFPKSIVSCDVLMCGQPLCFQPGDAVMVSAPETANGNGCILGIIKSFNGTQSPTLPKHVQIDASESLSIRCGESSIDLRKDGKLMIRANDVLTKAKRTNRIKGGSVAIN